MFEVKHLVVRVRCNNFTSAECLRDHVTMVSCYFAAYGIPGRLKSNQSYFGYDLNSKTSAFGVFLLCQLASFTYNTLGGASRPCVFGGGTAMLVTWCCDACDVTPVPKGHVRRPGRQFKNSLGWISTWRGCTVFCEGFWEVFCLNSCWISILTSWWRSQLARQSVKVGFWLGVTCLLEEEVERVCL